MSCLENHKWKDRVIVILSNTSTAERAERQLKAFKENSGALIDRKLVIYSVSENDVQFKAYHESAGVSKCNVQDFRKKFQTNFKVLLIGLDGGIKASHKKPVDPQVIFDQIDQMPMRKAEMRKNE